MQQATLLDHMQTAVIGALAGGKEILKVYDSEFAVEHKDDKSPLTLADKNAHLAIKAFLDKTDLPTLSEEGRSIPYDERRDWDYFWMVDPLDGTKEFVKRNGEFTVNIALIHEGRSVAGVIYVPVKQVLYLGIEGLGAWKLDGVTEAPATIAELMTDETRIPADQGKEAYTIVASRSHMSPETEAIIKTKEAEHGKVAVTSMGSSLKICLVAEGSADLYPRYAPTMEWDTAAGHAIVTAAGKTITDYQTGEEMRYNKENLLNNWFTVA